MLDPGGLALLEKIGDIGFGIWRFFFDLSITIVYSSRQRFILASIQT
jgi:hypothetical protein